MANDESSNRPGGQRWVTVQRKTRIVCSVREKVVTYVISNTFHVLVRRAILSKNPLTRELLATSCVESLPSELIFALQLFNFLPI